MEQIDQITLMAYVDGELAPPEQAEVEQALASDSDLREQLQQLQQLDSLLGAALNQPMNEPQPAIRGLEAGLVDQPLSWLERWGISRSVGLPLGAAALLLLGFGIGGWYQNQWWQDAMLGQQQRFEQAIEQALENHLSGDPLQWSYEQSRQRGTITPVRTFRNQQGQFCREFIDRRRKAEQILEQRGIACRDQQGWQVMASFYL